VLIEPVRRQLVVVSGPPAAGKTTIAGPLAAELGFTLLAKDRIKETLHESLAGDGGPGSPSGPGEGFGLAWSKRLGAASMELLWALAAQAPAVLLEANFYTDDPRSRSRLAALAANPVEVFCQCPKEEYLRRYAERVPSRHGAHADSAPSRLAEGFTRSSRPFGLGPVITVDTTRPVDVPALAREVRLRLSGAGVSPS
jgi:predicted kinase